MIHLFAQALASPEPWWLDVVVKIGVPAAILGLLLYLGLPYHERVVKAKDEELARVNKELNAEITRINEARVRDAEARADKQLLRDEKFANLLQAVHGALELLDERIKGPIK